MQQVNDSQSIAMKINSIFIIKKLSFSQNEHNEEKLYNEKMLMKIRAARHKKTFSARKISWKFLLKQFARVIKNRKQKKIILLAIKNIRNENYSNAVNLTNKIVFNKNSKSINVSCAAVTMKEILVDFNSNSRAVKYKKIKLIKFNSVEIVEIIKKT